MTRTISGNPSRKTGCLIAFGILGAVGVAGSRRTEQSAPATAQDPVSLAETRRDDRDALTLQTGQAAVTALLKDPSSATFARSRGRLIHGERVACGFVNAKNSFGALAGDNQWVIRVEQGGALIRSVTNDSAFIHAWNRYCVGPSDDLKTAPTAFLGVRLGGKAPWFLKSYAGSNGVRVFGDHKPRIYLNMSVQEPTFVVERGRVVGAQATAIGREAYDQLRLRMFQAYGTPTSDSGEDDRSTVWNWGEGGTHVQLTYRPTHNQTTISLTSRD